MVTKIEDDIKSSTYECQNNDYPVYKKNNDWIICVDCYEMNIILQIETNKYDNNEKVLYG